MTDADIKLTSKLLVSTNHPAVPILGGRTVSLKISCQYSNQVYRFTNLVDDMVNDDAKFSSLIKGSCNDFFQSAEDKCIILGP